MNNTNLTVQILEYINSNTGVNEFVIAKKFYNGRVLQARHICQHLLWTNVIVPAPNWGYTLSPLAKEAYKAALQLIDSVEIDVTDI
jgi:hypothetical protein